MKVQHCLVFLISTETKETLVEVLQLRDIQEMDQTARTSCAWQQVGLCFCKKV